MKKLGVKQARGTTGRQRDSGRAGATVDVEYISGSTSGDRGYTVAIERSFDNPAQMAGSSPATTSSRSPYEKIQLAPSFGLPYPIIR
jgi:hypothetical protein